MSIFSSPFGSTTAAGSTPGQGGGGMFGGASTTTPSSTGSFFGTQQLQSQPQQQQQQQQTNFANLGTGTSTGLFGGGPTSMFGAGQQQQQPQQQTGGGGSGGGGFFGGASTSGTTGGGPFGGGQQQQQQPQQQQPQQTSGPGLFGGQSTTTGGLGFFGQPQPQQQQTGGGSSIFGGGAGTTTGGGGGGGFFGTQQPQQQQQTGSGLFNTTTQGQPQQQQSGSLFSQPQQQSQLGGSGMQTPGGGMNQSMAGSQYGQAPGNRVIYELKKVMQKWDRNSPDCEFRVYFYNNIGADNASRHVKSQNEDEKAYDKAWTERPSSGAVPVLAIGFGDLEIRVKSQQNQVYAFRTTLHAIQEKLSTLSQKHDLATSIKLDDCRRRHISLARRALALAAQVQVLKNRGYALQPEEEQLKKKLDALGKSVFDPSIVGRVNEIWARMMVVRERARMMEGELEMKGGGEWDEKLLKTTGELLGQNAKGLEFLAKEVKEIEKELGEVEVEMSKGVGAGQGEKR
ncbi:nucleoporin complex subunit 54-domain-containing protein [Tirmania nivea]|nr:nucleoporin complex subunit 54-domain-containing protein [Tirmania nivea]